MRKRQTDVYAKRGFGGRMVWHAMSVFFISLALMIPSLATTVGAPTVSDDDQMPPVATTVGKSAGSDDDQMPPVATTVVKSAGSDDDKMPGVAAVCPGLQNGLATRDGTRLALEFPYAFENPVFLDGQAVRLPISFGDKNTGTLSILLDSSMQVEPRYGRIVLHASGELPRQGQRVRVGEAVLALVRQPLYHEEIVPRMPAPALDEVHVYGAANAVGVAARDLPPAGYISRVIVWLENRADREWRICLGPAPEPVSGKLVDRTVSEALRYVTSDTLLPQTYEPGLTWSRTLPCIRNGGTYAFSTEMMPALQTMLRDAARTGVSFYSLSYSYRSAALQKQLFDRRLALSRADATILDPLGATLRRVTRPNGSEHQTGMAMDIFSTTSSGVAFANTRQYAFINDHGWHYGFVVRYPDAAEHMTRIMFEPWHIRWFDRPVAAWLHREDRVYEELVAEVRQQGTRWLGGCDAGQLPTAATAATAFLDASPVYADPDILWLAVAATPEAVYGSAVSGYAPEICAFLPETQMWLVPMGAQ